MYKKFNKTYTFSFEYFSSNPFICNHYKFKSDQEYEERRIEYDKDGHMKNKLGHSQTSNWKKKSNSINNTILKDKYSKLLKNFMKTKIKDLPQVTKKNISVVTMFRYEDNYLLEWLYYYIMHGIDHFYLYSHKNTEKTYNILKPFINKGYVTFINWTDNELEKIPKDKRRLEYGGIVGWDKISLQNLAFMDFVKNYKNDTKWIIKVDVDEFIYLSDNNLFINDILDNTEKNYFSVPRVDFGNNGHKTKPSGLIIDNYTKSEEKSSSSKAIALTKFISNDDKGGAHNFKMI